MNPKQIVVENFESEIKRLENVFHISLQHVKLEFVSKKHFLGQASLEKNIVRINTDYLNTINNIKEITEQTITHEICHIIAYVNYKEAGHGRYWKYCMMIAGKSPDRLCASSKLDKKENARKLTLCDLSCPKCGKIYKMTKSRYTRIVAKTTPSRICTICKGDLSFGKLVNMEVK